MSRLRDLGLFMMMAPLTFGACELAFTTRERADAPRDASAPVDGPSVDAPLGEAGTGSVYPDLVEADTPIVYLRFGEKSGTVAHDEMGHADGTYPATVSLGTAGAIAGDPDTAVAVDGTARIRMPDGVDFAGLAPFSVEVWVRPENGTDGYGYVLDHQTFTPRGGWEIIAGGNGVFFERWADGTDGSSASITTSGLTFGVWHHFVGTFDGTTQDLFVDGQKVATTMGTASLPTLDGGWSIGGQNCDCTGNRFVGAIDELAIYGHALPEPRVVEHFRAGKP